MGCTQSKIENEETVSRCKDRKQFMKEAVSARNAYAAACAAYPVTLKNTGAALSDYAHAQTHGNTDVQTPSSPGLPKPPSYVPLPPPPPPLNFTPPPLQRAATMPEFSIPKPDFRHAEPIIEEENEDDESNHDLRHRTSKSSGGATDSKAKIPDKGSKNNGIPSPPYPPQISRNENERAPPPPPHLSEAKLMSWDDFFPTMENVPGSSLDDLDAERNRMEREEIARKTLEERSKTNEVNSAGAVESEGGGDTGSGEAEAEVEENLAELRPQPPPPVDSEVKNAKRPVASDGKRKNLQSVSLLQIFSQLDDFFLKASESAHDVSKMLEANRLHYHSNFADNRGHIDHSVRVMRVITWNRSFKGLPEVDNDNYDSDSEENQSHATVLDKMLAWEKKLYDEVKAGEQMKLEYQRKVGALNKLKRRGSKTEALERMKAAVSHLHTRYIVDMQSMDSTVSEINRLRDEQLYPRLVALVDEMATMWHSMQEYHEHQSQIVQGLKLVDISQLPKETSDYHHERTIQLCAVVQGWLSQFEKFMTHQKEYIKALKDWLKLNLIPIDNNLKEKVSSPQRPQNPPIYGLLLAWNDSLETLPHELAKTALNNFKGVVNSIVEYQVEEMKLRNKCKDTQKDLMRKTRHFEDWYNKYSQKRTQPDETDPEDARDKELIAEKQAVMEAVKYRLQEEEEAYRRECIQVREKSLTTLRTRMPELFRAMSDFSVVCANMYENLRSFPTTPHFVN